MKKQKISLVTIISFALLLGIPFGWLAKVFEFQDFVAIWINPFATLFMQSLKFIAIPLIVFSILNGFANLKDISQLTKIAGRTIAAYLATTIGAVCLGLLLANTFRPGTWISEATRNQLLAQERGIKNGEAIDTPLQFLVDLIPDFGQVNTISLIIITLVFAIAVINLPEQERHHLSNLFNAINEMIMKVVDFIMRYLAPIGVFALMANIISNTSGQDLFYAFLVYGITVVTGLCLLIFVIYPLLARQFTGTPYRSFLKAITPAQLVAFTTSSSAATLAMTMKCVEENLKVRKEVSGFILPLGSTVNMDGTCVYLGIGCLFIAQAFGIELSLMDQIATLIVVTLASIGSAAVPSGSIVMLSAILTQIGLPVAGIALILPLDRILDMGRTVANITGDAMIAKVIDDRLPET